MTGLRLRGFTLVELLVVIAIIGVLVALLLPAIQAAREAARRVQCQSQLKQLALAAITHEEQQGHFPTGGWSIRWTGDPDRGFGEGQPGGWPFNILPFLEEGNLYDSARDGLPERMTPQQLEAAKRVIETPVSINYCPSRRAPAAYPRSVETVILNSTAHSVVGVVDYAACYGDIREVWTYAGPSTLQEYGTPADRDRWCFDTLGNQRLDCKSIIEHVANPLGGVAELNGVIFVRSEVGVRHVADGTSKTYLIGEKYVDIQHYEMARDPGDYNPWVGGMWIHSGRSGNFPPSQDLYNVHRSWHYGSPHPGGMNMAYCDGSVRVVDYDVHLSIHRACSNRHDGTVNGIGMPSEINVNVGR